MIFSYISLNWRKWFFIKKYFTKKHDIFIYGSFSPTIFGRIFIWPKSVIGFFKKKIRPLFFLRLPYKFSQPWSNKLLWDKMKVYMRTDQVLSYSGGTLVRPWRTRAYLQYSGFYIRYMLSWNSIIIYSCIGYKMVNLTIQWRTGRGGDDVYDTPPPQKKKKSSVRPCLF